MHVQIHKQKILKWDAKNKTDIFVGYSEDTEVY